MELTIAAAVWPISPTHDIVQLLTTPCERAAVVTASATGQLCIWGIVEGNDGTEGCAAAMLQPRAMLLGHTAPVIWLSVCRFERTDALVSLCTDGHLHIW